jgi:hypothetical protein
MEAVSRAVYQLGLRRQITSKQEFVPEFQQYVAGTGVIVIVIVIVRVLGRLLVWYSGLLFVPEFQQWQVKNIADL